uniref:Uncharacterized protein n=1 Tax=Kalanchoe fedtschenkoi TaxID=63787 RepID=A0A7N0TQC4_KALFE
MADEEDGEEIKEVGNFGLFDQRIAEYKILKLIHHQSTSSSLAQKKQRFGRSAPLWFEKGKQAEVDKVRGQSRAGSRS